MEKIPISRPHTVAKYEKETGDTSTTETAIEMIQMLRRLEKGKSRALTIQDAVDLSISQMPQDIARKVQCKKGCANCCRINVDISDDEAELIGDYLKEKPELVDMERLELQKDWKEDDYIKSFQGDKGVCPLLQEDKTCGIYPVRPVACRVFLVKSDPKYCDPRAGRNPEILFNINNYALSMAANSLDEDLMSRKNQGLSHKLWKKLKGLKNV